MTDLQSEKMRANGSSSYRGDERELPAGSLVLGGTVASTPGRVRAKLDLYFKCYPLWGIIWALALPASFALPLLLFPGSWKAWLAPVVALLANLFYWFQVRAHFMSGNIVPCRMISESPPLFAAVTDLAKDEDAEPYPVIKIFKQPIHRMAMPIPREGDRCAAVALYIRDKNGRAKNWKNFDPKLVNCATEDEAEVDRVISEVPDEDWQRLDNAIARLKQPYRKGVYPLSASSE